MDGDFYQDLLLQRQQGNISDDEVTSMMAAHLQRVEDFMAKIKLQQPKKKNKPVKARAIDTVFDEITASVFRGITL